MRKAIAGCFAVIIAAATGAAQAQDAAKPAAEAPLPPAEAAPTSSAPSSSLGPITELQQQLQREGFAPGPVNGVMTEKTRRAIAAYQRRTGRLPQPLADGGRAPADTDPVRRIQIGLQRLGMFDGPVDGEVGPQTRDAIIRFEVAHRLPIDPRVSDRLLAAIDQTGAGAGATSAPAAAVAQEPSAAPAAAAPAPDVTGRRSLPSWLNPPPLR